MTVEETVARFFPAGTGYDINQARRLINWLEARGYAIAPKEQAVGKKPKAAGRKAT
jgi:hypothetical protein